MTKKVIQPIIVFGTIIILLIGLVIWKRHDDKLIITGIRQNPAYSICTIIDFDKGSGGGGGTFIKISNRSPHAWITFYSGDSLVKELACGMLRADRDYTGDKFVVMFNKRNLEQCIILYDYPINDANDSVRYIENFKSNPPDFKKLEYKND